MNLKNLFITDTADFESRRLEVDRLFYCNATLPDQVFREDFKFFAFANWEAMFGAGFWPVIQELAEVSDDDSVLIGVFDADPSTFWRKHFGHYGWANIPVSISTCEFSELLNEDPTEESPPGGLQLYGHKVILVPQSAKWAIWGERRWETWVVGFQDDIPTRSLHGIRWAVDINLTLCFHYDTVSSDFREKFWSHYGNSDLEDRPLQLVIGGIDLVKGRVHGAGVAMTNVMKELDAELDRTRFLDDAPFKVIRLAIRFGTQWGEPDLTGINERYAELEARIELPMSEVQNLDNQRLPPAVLLPTTPLEHVVKKATLQVLVAVAQEYKLDGGIWEEKLASFPPSPPSPERRSPAKARRWRDYLWILVLVVLYCIVKWYTW